MGRLIASDGLELSYEVDDFSDPWRPGDPMVLLHSAMGCKERFFAWMPRLVRRYRVVRPDLRGHGQSAVPRSDQPVTIERLVSDILELLDGLGIDRAHFVGTSGGGYLAQRIAMDHPDRVATLCLFGSTPGFKGGQAQAWMPQIRAKGLRSFLAETISDRFPEDMIGSPLVNWFIDQAGGNDEAYIARFITLMDGQDWSDELYKISCPTLLVVPGLGKIGDYAGFDRMKRDIADITVKAYDGMPHNVWDSVPERCVADVISFLEGRAVSHEEAVEVA